MKLSLIILLVFLNSCASWVANEQRKERSELPPDKREEAKEKDLGIVEAVAADAIAVKEIVEAIADEITNNELHVPPKHEGSDSDLCTSPKVKVCSVKTGCICK